MYLSVPISQTDPAHQVGDVFHMVIMLRKDLALFFKTSPYFYLMLGSCSSVALGTLCGALCLYIF